MIDNLDVRIDFRATKGDFPYVVIAYDSTKDSFAKVRSLFPRLSPCGYTLLKDCALKHFQKVSYLRQLNVTFTLLIFQTDNLTSAPKEQVVLIMWR